VSNSTPKPPPGDPTGTAPASADLVDDALASGEPGQQRVESFIAALSGPGEGGSVLLCRGARNPNSFAERRTVAWALLGTSLRLLHEGWLEAADHGALLTWLLQRGPVQEGGCDGGPGSPVTVVWTTDGGQARVWVGASLRVDHDDRWVRIWRGRCALIPRAELTGVRVSLTRAWDRLAVSLVHGEGKRREVVSRPLWGASLDPGYDRADLVADCGWSVDLARALGDALGVDATLPPDLQQA